MDKVFSRPNMIMTDCQGIQDAVILRFFLCVKGSVGSALADFLP